MGLRSVEYGGRNRSQTPLANQLGGALVLVEADIVENDDVAGRQFGSELSFDVALEDGGIHRRVDDPRCDETVASQPGDEGLHLPFAEWRMRPVALALRRPAGALVSLVLVDVSSMKISRAKALLKKRFRRPIHSSRAWRTSARCCSLDCRVFYD